MQRDTVLQALSAHKQEMSTRYGVTRLGIFGSVARNQGTDASDVDIVVEMPPDLFQMVHMKADLEAILDAPVDLIRYHKYLDAFLRSQIDRDAVYV